MLYLDLQQHSRQAGDEVCEAGVCHTLRSILGRVAHLYHLLGLFFTAPSQLCRMIWNHALIRCELNQHIWDSNTAKRTFSSPFPRQRSEIVVLEPGEEYLLTYLTAVLLDFMQHLVEVLIELFKLKHCSSVSPLEIWVDRHRVRLLNTKTQLYLLGLIAQHLRSNSFKKKKKRWLYHFLCLCVHFF